MDWKRRKKLMLRWSILTAVLIALFWTIYYLIAGSVPVITSIKMTPDSTLALPFAISRWWDILLGPIFSCIFVLLFTSRKIKGEMMVPGLIFGLVVGLICGLVGGLGGGLILSVGSGLAGGLILSVGMSNSPHIGLGVGLGLSLSISIFFSLGAGLGTGLGFFGLGTILFSGLNFICTKTFWKTVSDYIKV